MTTLKILNDSAGPDYNPTDTLSLICGQNDVNSCLTAADNTSSFTPKQPTAGLG